ncbi:MAG: phosphoribosylaminoimidazolesuccinocarboxamide synthase [Candidatus Kryptoniota bacterium]
MEKVMIYSDLSGLKLIKRGKVRDIYDLGDRLLFVATDRISAFDVVLPDGIPYKGKVLNLISQFWFDFTKSIVNNHVITGNVREYPAVCQPYRDDLEGRSMVVKKAKPLPVECIVRGYLTGSGWNDYLKTGRVCGISLPSDLKESDKLPQPIFTPSTKAEIGLHDENITFDDMIRLVGEKVAVTVREYAINVYQKAAEFAEKRGIIIADTKMEFGFDERGKLILIDELLTPDSSRFWDLEKYRAGRSQESFDKQFVRDYLLSINFNRKPPAPDLPEEVIRGTSQRYLEALRRIAGIELPLHSQFLDSIK